MSEDETLRGYIIKKRKGLDHWDSLLEEWLLCTERYCRVAAGEDAPFIYTERANIGILAGAAWRCGRTALEEFQYQKGYRNKEKWNGRADLYLASEGNEELVEAKFGWLSLASSCKATNRVTSLLNAAISDAKQTNGSNKNLACLAVAFFPTWLPKARSDTLDEQIKAIISTLQAAPIYDALAWCFPKEYRRVESSKGNYTPGIIMASKNPRYT